jgi:hypothetical protein
MIYFCENLGQGVCDMAADITELVRRTVDLPTDEGAQREVEQARSLLRKKVVDDPITSKLRIWLGDMNRSENVMNIVMEYKRPLEERIVQLEQELRKKDSRKTGSTIHQDDMLRQYADQIKLLEAEVAELKARSIRKRVNKTEEIEKNDNNDNTIWTPELYQQVLGLLMTGQGKQAITIATGLRPGQIDGRFTNKRPDESLLGKAIPILDDGLMDYLELWKIGFHLHGQQWKKFLEYRFGIKWKSIVYNPPEKLLTVEQCNQLRHEFKHYPQLTAKSQSVLDKIRDAGPDGTSVKTGHGHQRVPELHTLKLIFESERREGRGAMVWIASEYSDRDRWNQWDHNRKS